MPHLHGHRSTAHNLQDNDVDSLHRFKLAFHEFRMLYDGFDRIDILPVDDMQESLSDRLIPVFNAIILTKAGVLF
jgi:hypothetical protein